MLILSADKLAYRIGEMPILSISGGTPNEKTLWSTWRNGVQTAYQADWSLPLDISGGAARNIGAVNYPGEWIEEVRVKRPDGAYETATTAFVVIPEASTPLPPVPPVPDPNAPIPEPTETGGFFDSSVDLFGQSIPTWALVAGGVLAFFMLGKRGR